MPERYLGTLLGKYRVDELIGSGGFAWVYRGYDAELEIPVALKVLKPQFGGDNDFVARFKREATTAAKLRHPNIVKIYTVGLDRDAVYFAMDYLSSGLADKLESADFLGEDAVIRIGMDVARALGFAHREGVIHRDIKVDNIMFDDHGNAVVADFGIARALTGYTNQTGTNMVVGTPQYFAPEQARAKPLDGRADIYSLGVTLYRAATGRLPFVGEDWYEVARQHVEEPPPALRSLNPHITAEFEAVILRCLAKKADDRPTTGEQLYDELDAVRASNHPTGTGSSRTLAVPSLADTSFAQPINAGTTPSESPRVVRTDSSRRERRTVWLTAALLLLLVAAAVPLLARRLPEGRGGTNSGEHTLAGIIVAAPSPDSMLGAAASNDTTGKPLVVGVLRPRRDTLSPLARLTVSTPEDASLTLNGASISSGRWQTDTMRPGEYELAASVRTLGGCETASVRRRVSLRAGQARDMSLTPRACGALEIDGRGRRAQFALEATDGNVRREGTLPLANPLVLPVGSYRLTVSKLPEAAEYCTDYKEDALEIKAEQTRRVTFALICGAK
ncbi:MAG: serine/threonine-protein kinase [Gemmatimonadaceae bacterium]